MKRRLSVWRIALAALLAGTLPAAATSLTGEGTLFSPAFLPDVDDEVIVLASNTGQRGVTVEIQLLRAADFSVVEAKSSIRLPPGTSTQAFFSPDNVEVLVKVLYRSRQGTTARFSLQVRSSAGDTQIFTDGFESGDLSA